jgi:2-phospho-L-lactate transferase/gluconeogenesis factor (CofD/UPF0052 family)
VRNCLVALAGRRRLAEVFNYRFAGPVVSVTNVMMQHGVTSGYAVADHVRVMAEHVGHYGPDVFVYPGDLRPEHLVRFAARQAASVEVDREVLWEMGFRVREASLLSEKAAARVRHPPGRFAKEVGEVVLVRL